MWAVVLVANLIGTIPFAWLVARSRAFRPGVVQALKEIAHGAFSESFGLGVLRAIFSGWLIALMVWLLPSAKRGLVTKGLAMRSLCC